MEEGVVRKMRMSGNTSNVTQKAGVKLGGISGQPSGYIETPRVGGHTSNMTPSQGVKGKFGSAGSANAKSR